MVFALGVRHGFDLDHLATIDSITRSVKNNPRLSKLVGILFSLGHGLVVILISLIIGGGLVHVNTPLWLEPMGQWVSILFLFVFGLLTLWNVIPHSHVVPTNIKTLIIKKWFGETGHPFLIVLIGALFAFSFDTFTQVALFSISVSVMAGTIFSILLGVVFMLGMMTSDGLNGFFVSTMIQCADQRSLLVSRLIGLAIASFSLVLGIVGLLNVI